MAPSFWDQSSSEQNEVFPSLLKCLPRVLCLCCAAITPLSQGEELNEEKKIWNFPYALTLKNPFPIPWASLWALLGFRLPLSLGQVIPKRKKGVKFSGT